MAWVKDLIKARRMAISATIPNKLRLCLDGFEDKSFGYDFSDGSILQRRVDDS